MKNLFFSSLLETINYRYGVISYFKNDAVIGVALHEYGEWAQKEIDFLLQLIQPGDIVFDIGAFIGTHALAFAQKAGLEGRVYSFEPNPVSFEVLKRNVEQNRLPNVICENAALSNEEAVQSFDLTEWVDNNPGSNTLIPAGGDSQKASSFSDEILTKRLDQFAVPRCRLVKIDVEGMELEVLEGGRNFLQAHRPFVYAECLSVDNGARIIAFMDKENYLGYIHSVEAYSAKNYFNNPNNNIFGTAREVGIVFVPLEKKSEFQNLLKNSQEVIQYRTLDDLVVAMINKPQYKYEVLAKTNASKSQNINYNLEDEGAVNEKVNNLMEINDQLTLQVEAKDQHIQELTGQVEAKDQHIQELTGQVEQKISQIQELTNEVTSKNLFQKELAARIDELKMEHDTAIQELTLKHNEALQKKVQALQTLLTRLAARDNSIDALEAQLAMQTRDAQTFSQQLWEIKHSRAWRGVQKLWRLRLRLLPPGSRRVRIIGSVYRGTRLLFTQGLPPFIRRAREKASAVPSQPPAGNPAVQPVDRAKHPDPVYHPAFHAPPQMLQQTSSPDAAVAGGSLPERVKESLKHREFVVSISHDDYLTILGGSQIFMADEQKLLEKRDVSYIHLYPVSQNDYLNDEPLLSVGVNVDSTLLGHYPVDEVAQLFTSSLGVDYACLSINLHQFKGWTICGLKSILSAARPKRYIFYVHDFYSACPQYTLLRNNREFCNAPALESHACGICVFGEKRKIHLPLVKELFTGFPFIVVAPSKSASNLWQKTFPEFAENVRVEPHLVVKDSDIPLPPKTSATIRLAYSGGPARNKGWEFWRALVENFFTNPNYQFFHLGIRYEEHPETYENVRVSKTNRNAMLKALRRNQIDVLFHCPIWPETFSYVLFEAVDAGCFILTVKASGNVADYVAENKNGLVFETFADLKKYIADPENLRSDLADFRRLNPRQKTIEINETIPDLITTASLGE